MIKLYDFEGGGAKEKRRMVGGKCDNTKENPLETPIK